MVRRKNTLREGIRRNEKREPDFHSKKKSDLRQEIFYLFFRGETDAGKGRAGGDELEELRGGPERDKSGMGKRGKTCCRDFTSQRGLFKMRYKGGG